MMVRRGRFAAQVSLLLWATAPTVAHAMTTHAMVGRNVPVETEPGDAQSVAALMGSFANAYQSRDRAALAAVVTPDFIWHLHSKGPDFRGETVEGVDGMLAVLTRRAIAWSGVRYSECRIDATASVVIQTCRVSGVDRSSGPFDANNVDVYLLRDGKIAVKDSYWKQLAGGQIGAAP